LALCVLALTACSDDGGGVVVPGGGGPSDVLDMTGSWALTVNRVDPPFAFDCTGDLAGRTFSFCDRFEVAVVQDGVNFLPDPGGGPGDPFCDSRFEMSGSSTLREISGTVRRSRDTGVVPVVLEIENLEFQAGVIGDSATFALARLTIEGVNGACTLGGSYLGLRTESP